MFWQLEKHNASAQTQRFVLCCVLYCWLDNEIKALLRSSALGTFWHYSKISEKANEDLSYKNTSSFQHVQYEKHHQLFIFSQYLIA